MATEFKIKDMLSVLYTSMAGISDNIFITTRPKSVAAEMSDFIVVSLPVSIDSDLCGTGHGRTSTICRIELCARDTSNGENIVRLNEMLGMTLDKFPITNDTIEITHPRVIMSGSDDYEFHIVTIQANLLTK